MSLIHVGKSHIECLDSRSLISEMLHGNNSRQAEATEQRYARAIAYGMYICVYVCMHVYNSVTAHLYVTCPDTYMDSLTAVTY